MKREHILFIYKDNSLKEIKAKEKYKKVEEYWEKRKIECEKNLSKFC